MKAGALRHLVTLEQLASGAQDEAGQSSAVWRPFVQARASIETLAVRELLASQGTAAGATHKITIRWQPRLESTTAVAAMRIRYRDRTFNIKGAANLDEQNREIWMLAEEGLNQR